MAGDEGFALMGEHQKCAAVINFTNAVSGIPEARSGECAFGTPVRITSTRRQQKSPSYMMDFFCWLGRQYDNGTFTDEDFQNVDDVEEIQKLLDDTAADESCSE